MKPEEIKEIIQTTDPLEVNQKIAEGYRLFKSYVGRIKHADVEEAKMVYVLARK